MRMRRSLLTLMAVILTVMSVAPVAHAVQYEYWSYWHATDGAWTFSGVGPASVVPADGSVEGWRFAVSDVQGREAPAFEATTAFDTVCADAAVPPPEAKRVALIIDTGAGVTTSCEVINAEATGYDILTSTHELRTERGFVCAVDGIPEHGCGDVVDDASSTPTAKPTPSSSTSPTSSPTPTPTRSATATAPPSDATTEPGPEPSSAPANASPVSSATEPTNAFPWLPTVIVLGAIALIGVVLVVRRR